MVVEEIVLDEIRTVVSTWPMLDPDGQLLFGDPEDAAEYLDPRAGIGRLLNERRIVPIEELEERSIEVGDVYAVLGPVGGGSGGGWPDGGGGGVQLVDALEELVDVEIYDITADARLAATATHSAATAGVLSPSDVERYFDDGEDETNNEGGTPTPSPTGGGRDSGGGAPRSGSLEDAVRTRAVATEEEEVRPATASAGA